MKWFGKWFKAKTKEPRCKDCQYLYRNYGDYHCGVNTYQDTGANWAVELNDFCQKFKVKEAPHVP